MSSSTKPATFNVGYPGFYQRVPFTYVNGQPVWYVWDATKKAWVLPK